MMTTTTTLILIYVLLAAVVIILLNKYVRVIDRINKNVYDALLSREALEKHAIELARTHVLSKNKQSAKRLLFRLNENYKYISEVYKKLNKHVNMKKRTVPAAEWLLDNFYIIEQQVKDVRQNISKKYYNQLPTLKEGQLQGYPRVYALALELVAHTDGGFDDKVLVHFIKAYQTQKLLSIGEIWALSIMIRMALVENIRRICERIDNSQEQLLKADELVRLIMSKRHEPPELLVQLVKEKMKGIEKIHPSYAEYVLQKIKKEGRSVAPIIQFFDERLSGQDTTTENMIRQEHQDQAVLQVSMGNSITSFRLLSALDWADIFEALSQVEKVLQQDPAGVYLNMDFESRDYYRSRVVELARKMKTSEMKVAKKAVECAAAYQKEFAYSNEADRRQEHVGYYLIGKGEYILKTRIGYQPTGIQKIIQAVSRYPSTIYLGSLLLITATILLLLMYYAAMTSMSAWKTVLVGIIALIPASELAVSTVNWLVTHVLPAAILPKLELKEGIPEEHAAIVVVPTLLPNAERVKELLAQLEVYYLANREKNLYFGLLGDFKDAPEKELPDDDAIIRTAIIGINELNKKYGQQGKDIFYFFHRHRQYNEKQDTWMGWERKRGALMEFNDFIKGAEGTSFSVVSGEPSELSKVKYIITLDADTKLLRGVAKKLVGTMAHPLNRPIIDRRLGRVVEGYGLLQPRISVDIESANQTLFSRIFAGQGGIDPYTVAVSDVYQDLFGEAIFTGKGIYDIDVFQKTLKNAIPENTVLSHDLLEGSYVRVGLVTDIELIDGYPTRYNSYMARMHRWVRGDWQLIPWLRSKVRNRLGQYEQNPLSIISKWKIIDNLRRSLLAPALLLLIILGFGILPGNNLVWLLFAMLTIAFTLVTSTIDAVLAKSYRFYRERCHATIICGVKAALYQVGLLLMFLPYQAYVMGDAIARTLVRVFFTRKNMLEWVTAADVERRLKNDISSFWRRMWVCMVAGVIVMAVAIFFESSIWPAALVLLTVWTVAPFTAYRVSQIEDDGLPDLPPQDRMELRRLARKTWRYFEDFITPADHYLPPDNYQENPPNGVAHRTSPTNIGLLLVSTLAARDLGYIGTMEMHERLYHTLATVQKMKKWKGHLYNWYDTRTLKALRPRYVSTVDSGNFVGYLITLKQGLMEYMSRPVIDTALVEGLKDTLLLLMEESKEVEIDLKPLDKIIQKGQILLTEWRNLLDTLSKAIAEQRIKTDSWWKYKTASMLDRFKQELDMFMTWTKVYDNMPGTMSSLGNSYWEISNKIKEILHAFEADMSIKGLQKKCTEVINDIDKVAVVLEGLKTEKEQTVDPKDHDLITAWVDELKKAVETSYFHLTQFLNRYGNLVNMLDELIEQTEFAPLFDEKRQLFSIGYNLEEEKLTKSYYDLLASEARQASFIAIAKGEVNPKHWFRLGRNLTIEDGYRGLVSWTGTMFEYLMPMLTMRNYKNTLWDETYWFVLRSQKKYGKQREVPWGTSESGYYAFDMHLNYQYKALGVPGLGLKRGLINDMVVAPYASVMAVMLDPRGVVSNIRRLKLEGLDGPYGLYEAIDYTPQRLGQNQKSGIVKSFMVHHQGMSLMALTNYLHGNNMQDRFHADPVIKSAEFLLQERVPIHVITTKENKEKIRPLKPVLKDYEDFTRKLGIPEGLVPNVHILSNNSYSVMVTESGTGYTKNQSTLMTRWREYTTEQNFGMFFYIRRIENNRTWAATYAPYYTEPEKYKVSFSPDKAEYLRRDGKIDTYTKIVVSPEDNAEIRCITLTNHGQETATLEVTSYFEVVLTNQSADVAHPAFSNLFVRTEFDAENNTLIANRRPREEGKTETWAVHTILVEGQQIGGIQYETDRAKFIGRGRSVSNPVSVEADHPLSDTVGAVLDPVMSLRARVRVEPGQKARLSFITGICETRDEALKLAQKYQQSTKVNRAFELAWTRSQVEARYLGLRAGERELYDKMIAQILFFNPLRRKREQMIKQNKYGQPRLWAYGISGDVPMVLVSVSKVDEADMVQQLLKAHEYWRMKGIHVDLIILNEDENSYTQPLQDLIRDMVSASHARELQNQPGGVFILPGKSMPKEDKALLLTVARVAFKGNAGSLVSQMQMDAEEQGIPGLKQWQRIREIYKMHKPDVENLSFDNDWGGFAKDGKEYVIQLKEGQYTPLPWSNVIANHRFGFLVTESGGGYTWSQNSRENKLTVWSNDPVSDPASEVIYLRDEEQGEVWTVTPLPIRGPETYVIRHGYGYTVFEHNSHGIGQKLTMFVPRQEPVKVYLLQLKNESGTPRKLSATYYMRPVLGVTDQLTAPYISSEVDEEKQIVLIKNHYNTDFPGRLAFIDVSESQRSYTGDATEFLGKRADLCMPDALKREKLSGRTGAGYNPCGAMQVVIDLKAGEEREVVFILGQSKDIQEIKMLCKKYRDIGQVRRALQNVRTFWEDMLDVIRVKTPDLSMNYILNGWLLYQALSCRIWGRSAFYQSGGAYGFRDQLQDVMALIYTLPEIVYSQILRHAAHQFVEGDVQHWWHPVDYKEPGMGDKGIRSKFSDDLVWLPFVVADYIESTQDYSVLEEKIGYIESEPLGEDEDERYSIPRVSDQVSSVYEHCIRVLERALKFGEHGIPLMGSGDWNDGMNTVGNKGKGESVWLGWFLYHTLMRFIPICEAKKDRDRVNKYKEIAREMAINLNKNAWDGSWYRRAYFDDGTPMGSAQNTECKIDSLAQSWAVISEAGEPEKVKEAMEALEHYLIKRDEGIIMLLAPPFDQGDLSPGYIKGYVPGVRENGGQYTHAAIWVVYAFAKMGYGDKAWELYHMINPINHARTSMEAARYKVEPYVMAADVYAVHPNIGRGGWTWYTGAAGWMYRVGIEHILGMKKRGNKIYMVPCIPKSWEEYSIIYKNGITPHYITVKNPDGVNTGVKKVTVDGKVVADKGINLLNDGKKHTIEVTMG